MTKAEDIELTLIRINEARRNFTYPSQTRAIVHVRRAFVGNRIIEFPKWLSELWLLDGHWEAVSAKNISVEALVNELETVRALVREDA